MSPEARERSFDELARGLASGTLSRGKALRLMGAALVGGLLASLPGIAQADDLCNTCLRDQEGTTCCRRSGHSASCCVVALGEVCCRYTDSAGIRQKNCQTVAGCAALNGRIVKK